MTISRCCHLVAGLALLCTPLLADDSFGTHVTVANAGREPLQFSATAFVLGEGQRFTLTAKRPPNQKPPLVGPLQLAGRLMVFDGKTPIVDCELERPSGHQVSYSFFVSRRFLEDSVLVISVIGKNKLVDLPEGENYWFYLKDLVEMATLSAQQQPKK